MEKNGKSVDLAKLYKGLKSSFLSFFRATLNLILGLMQFLIGVFVYVVTLFVSFIRRVSKPDKKAKIVQQKKNNETLGYFVLVFSYFALIINTVLVNKGIYSIEWALVGFFLVMVLFLILKIDSRFLILPAIFLIAYCPFLLIWKLEMYAETSAIYAFYFLVIGVVMQFFEFTRKSSAMIDFDAAIKKIFQDDFFSRPNIVLVLIGLAIWIINKTNPDRLTNFAVSTVVYLLSLVSILNLISIAYRQGAFSEN